MPSRFTSGWGSWSGRVYKFAQLQTNCPIQICYNARARTHTHTHVYRPFKFLSYLFTITRLIELRTHSTYPPTITLSITDARWRTAVTVAAWNKSNNFVLCSVAAQPTSNHKVSGITAVASPRYKAMRTTCVHSTKPIQMIIGKKTV